MKRTLAVAIASLVAIVTQAQAPSNWTSADMYLALRKLDVLGSVLYVAAHPDDENTRLITYLSKDKLFRTGYLSLTRGDGGQNLIGNEQGIDLGLIRTQELLSARRIDGGEQFFSRAYDFGFSKGPEETFTKWDREKILSDVVWVIRKYQPDVIITRFPTTGEGGHGHHTASAILANEAFTAAADPNRFPEQLQWVRPWQAKRIVWNTFNFGPVNTITSDQFRIDVGGYNPLLGKSYGEIAAESRSQHKSQGFGVAASRGESFESFKTTGGNAMKDDLMDGVNIEWTRIAGGADVSAAIRKLISSFDLLHPEKSVNALVKLYVRISQLPDNTWKTQKMTEVKRLIEQCSGLFLDVTTREQYAVQRDSIRFNFSFNNRLGADATLREVRVDQFDTSFNFVLAKNRNLDFSKTLYVPVTKPETQPYWLATEMNEGYFNVKDQTQIGQPDVDAAYNVSISIDVNGTPFTFTRAVKFKYTDPVRGELYQPVVVTPSVIVEVKPDFLFGTTTIHNKFEVDLSSLANTRLNNPHLRIHTPDTDDDVPNVNASDLRQFAKNQVRAFDLDGLGYPSRGPISVRLIDSTLAYDQKMISIRHDHIPNITYFKKVNIPFASTADFETYGKKIGYIVGAGDKVPEALEQMGYDVTLLTDKELARNNLSQYDAIITGVRAYNTNAWMNTYYDRLMKYVNDGGNLIVQYNTSSQIGPIRAKMGPYDFDVSRTRVTDENATVNFVNPDHPVLNFPNKITTDDFKNWVQERSIYHASGWDKKNFETVISMKDPGESADEGSLIIAKYGKGFFTYTGLVFFRELPAAVPGAYRLMANLIALNKKKAF